MLPKARLSRVWFLHRWLTSIHLRSGGEEVMLDVGGQDATEAFEDVGHSDEARETLEQLLVGTLKRNVTFFSPLFPYLAGPLNFPCCPCSFVLTDFGYSPATLTPKLSSPPLRPLPTRARPVWALPSTPLSSLEDSSPSVPTNTCSPSRPRRLKRIGAIRPKLFGGQGTYWTIQGMR